MDNDAINCTPELCTCAIGSDAAQPKAVQVGVPFFSLFRPTVQRKARTSPPCCPITATLPPARAPCVPASSLLPALRQCCLRTRHRLQVLVVIRHGESEYNAAARQSPGWQDPRIFDPPLTDTGCRQACRLRAQLTEELRSNPCLTGNPQVLWVTSPLRRCIQTMLLSCPWLPEAPAHAAQSDASVAQRVRCKMSAMQGHALPRVKVVRCVALKVSAMLCRNALPHQASMGMQSHFRMPQAL